jgi:poly(A) polymerase
LLHDIGKPPTADYSGGEVHFYHHARVGAEMAGRVAERLRLSVAERDEMQWVIHHHLDFMHVRTMRPATLKRLFQSPHFATLAEVHRADLLGSSMTDADYRYVARQLKKLSAEEIRPAPLVSGHDVLALGLAAGPAVGRVLRQLYDEQLDGQLADRRAALRRAKELAATEIVGTRGR